MFDLGNKQWIPQAESYNANQDIDLILVLGDYKPKEDKQYGIMFAAIWV